MYTYWETVTAHNGQFIDKGKRFDNDKIAEVQSYGRNRLLYGDIKGWYIEDDNGKVIERHTHTIC